MNAILTGALRGATTEYAVAVPGRRTAGHPVDPVVLHRG